MNLKPSLATLLSGWDAINHKRLQPEMPVDQDEGEQIVEESIQDRGVEGRSFQEGRHLTACLGGLGAIGLGGIAGLGGFNGLGGLGSLGGLNSLGGLGGLLPFLLLGKGGGHGKDNLLPLLLLVGGLGGKGGKGGLGGNPLLLPLLLGKGKCDKPPGCVKPNTHNTLCGAGAGNTPCCVCSGHGLFGGL